MKLLYNLYQMKRSWNNSKQDSCKLEFEDPNLNLKDTSRVKGSRKEQKQGLTTAKYMQASFIKDIEDILNSEKENGLSYDAMNKVIAEKLKNRGWLPNEKQVPSRVKLIINNTIAVNKARDEYNSQMLAKDYYPYLRWKQQDRNNQRDSHKVLDGKVFSKDDPSLLSIYPPKGFNCNCVLIDTTQKEVDKNGYKVTPVDDAIKELDDSSKDYGGINWEPDLSKFPKDMQAKLKEVFDLIKPVETDLTIMSDSELIDHILENRLKYCTEEEFNNSWKKGSDNAKDMKKFLNGKLLTYEQFLDVFIPKEFQSKDARIYFEFKNNGDFGLKYENSFLKVDRDYDLNKNDMHHSFYKIKDEKYKDNGAMKETFLNQLALYKLAGIDNISVYANIDVGCYAWIKYGFKITTEADKNDYVSKIKRGLNIYLNDKKITEKNKDGDVTKRIMTDKEYKGYESLYIKVENNELSYPEEMLEWSIINKVDFKTFVINLNVGWVGNLDMNNTKIVANSIRYALKIKKKAKK